MNWTKHLPKIFGGRIFKTALAAFITAFVCEWLGWPPLFAVMASIVTIEPTSADSIKKGLIRFPASIIGAGYAMLFSELFDHTALTYALAATFTLYSCHKLKLQDGLIVATLTSVAMVSVIHGHYLSSFFVRMGTTFTGIAVSSLINYFIFPPKYAPVVKQQVTKLYNKTGRFLSKCLENLNNNSYDIQKEYEKLSKELDWAFRLIHYQRAEWAFHKHVTAQLRELHFNQRKLEHLRRVMYHIGNLIYQKVPTGLLSEEEYHLVLDAGRSLLWLFCHLDQPIPDSHHELIQKLNHKFCEVKEQALIEEGDNHYHHHFSAKLVVFYELLSLHDVLEELNILAKRYSSHERSEGRKHETETYV